MTLVRQLRSSVPWRPDLASAAPIFASIAEPAAAFADFAEFPSPTDIDGALGNSAGVRFVEAAIPSRRPKGGETRALYDKSIIERREVPTRSGSWHDYLNALIWSLFPRAKWALHARQHALVSSGLDPASQRLPGARTREQDALALFDEGGLVVACDAGTALDSGEAIEQAIAIGKARAVVFGHAIYESIVLGAAWPMVRAVVVEAPEMRAADALVAARISASDFADPALMPRVHVAAVTPLPRSQWPQDSPSP